MNCMGTVLHEKHAEMVQTILDTKSGLYELRYFQNTGYLQFYPWYVPYSPLHHGCLRSTYQLPQGNPVISTEIFYY